MQPAIEEADWAITEFGGAALGDTGGICMTPQKGALRGLAVYLASQNI